MSFPSKFASFLIVLVALLSWIASVNATPAPGETAVVAAADSLNLTWTIHTLDSAGDVGSHISMALQPGTARAHIVYHSVEEGLKLAVHAGVDGNCGPNNEWQCTVLHQRSESNEFVGRYPSLAFRSDGSYGVVYQHKQAGETINRYFDSQHNTTISLEYSSGIDANGRHNALVYDADNRPHLWYHRVEGVGFHLNSLFNKISSETTFPSGPSCSSPTTCRNWQPSNVPTAISANRDFLGNPAVAYIHYTDPDVQTLPMLSHAERRVTGSGGNCFNGEWQCTHISNLSYAFDRPQGYLGLSLYQRRCFLGANCHLPTTIAYYSVEHARLAVAEKVAGTDSRCNNSSEWRCGTVETVGVSPFGWHGDQYTRWPMGMDIVLNQDQLLLFYQDFTDPLNAKVKMAYKAATPGTGSCFNQNWNCVMVDDGVRGGGFVSVGFGLQAEALADGRILLAYHDRSHRDLIMAVTAVPAGPGPAESLVYLPLVVR
jgi:hypothetical protein